MAAVTKPLVATADMVEAGNLVVLTKTGGVAKRLPQEIVDQIFDLIKKAPGHAVPIERKGRKHVIEITVPKVVNKRVAMKKQEMKTIPVHNKYQSLESDDVEVGALFLRPAMRA